ncbi:MAG: hypothetical protein KKB70_00375 [Proteobacteria bacterium]|nr:hypothetical protein [Pseudomonadota bacterium]
MTKELSIDIRTARILIAASGWTEAKEGVFLSGSDSTSKPVVSFSEDGTVKVIRFGDLDWKAWSPSSRSEDFLLFVHELTRLGKLEMKFEPTKSQWRVIWMLKVPKKGWSGRGACSELLPEALCQTAESVVEDVVAGKLNFPE